MVAALRSAVLLVALLGASEGHRGCSGCSSAAEPSPSVLGNYSQWAVATDAAPCANVSRRIRQKGGTLADAAVATLLCMGVVLPESMGIGGGFLATVVKRSSGVEFALNARETAPGGASKDMFVDNPSAAMSGGLAVAVPGALRGYRALLDTFGTSLEWSVLFEDAIRLARNGFPLGFFQADALKSLERDIFTNENMRNVYWNTRTNTTYKEGETLVQKDLADTLENIAKQGVDYFYEGEFAQGMIEEIQKQKGLMTTADLSSYKVVWNRTTTARLSGGRVLHSVPPPGSGAVLAHILGIMDGYRDNATGRLADDSLTAHR
ncbi:scoloptoxin SSD14 [Ixodes scapularis]